MSVSSNGFSKDSRLFLPGMDPVNVVVSLTKGQAYDNMLLHSRVTVGAQSGLQSGLSRGYSRG